MSSVSQKRSLKRRLIRDFKMNKFLYLLFVLPLIWTVIFRYGPSFGLLLGFRRYIPGGSIIGEEWVGLRYFQLMFQDPIFFKALKNTFSLSFLNIAVNFPLPILFALMINELKEGVFKKTVQTVTYLPYFISVVVIVGFIFEILSPSTGIINELLLQFNIIDKPIYFANEAKYFRAIFVLSDTWQFTGWNTIIYLAALSGIDEQLYEAAMVDGAGRFKQTLHITIPGILPTIMLLFIMRCGSIIMVNFEKILLLYTPNNSEVSDVLSTLSYRIGIVGGSYSYGVAIAIFSIVVGLFFSLTANFISKKTTDIGLF